MPFSVTKMCPKTKKWHVFRLICNNCRNISAKRKTQVLDERELWIMPVLEWASLRHERTTVVVHTPGLLTYEYIVCSTPDQKSFHTSELSPFRRSELFRSQTCVFGLIGENGWWRGLWSVVRADLCGKSQNAVLVDAQGPMRDGVDRFSRYLVKTAQLIPQEKRSCHLRSNFCRKRYCHVKALLRKHLCRGDFALFRCRHAPIAKPVKEKECVAVLFF